MDIAKVKGIGPATVKIMAEHGLHTVEDIAAGGVDKLLEIPGFSHIRASRISGEVNNLLALEKPVARKPGKAVKAKMSGSSKIKKKSKKAEKKKAGKKNSKSRKKKKAVRKEKGGKKKEKNSNVKKKKAKKSTGKKVKKG